MVTYWKEKVLNVSWGFSAEKDWTTQLYCTWNNTWTAFFFSPSCSTYWFWHEMVASWISGVLNIDQMWDEQTMCTVWPSHLTILLLYMERITNILRFIAKTHPMWNAPFIQWFVPKAISFSFLTVNYLCLLQT